MNKKAIMLIQVIIIIVLLAIVASGIVIYLAEGLRFNVTKMNQEKALYMAQAGIMQAIADYDDGGLWDSATNVNVENEFYYHIGEDANFLRVDANNPLIESSAKKQLRRVPMKNINATETITITSMIVEWNFSGNIKQVWLKGSSVWSGNESSPATLDINDSTWNPGQERTGKYDQRWKFQGNIPQNFTVVVTFIFSDGSSFKTILAENQKAGNKEFSIKATGEIRSGSNVESRRTLEATYDTDTGEITSWEESQDHIMPPP